MNEIWFIVNYNLYESKKYFVQKLSEAFRRHGIGTRVIDFQLLNKENHFFQLSKSTPPSLICSFNTVEPDEKTGLFFFEEKKIPYLFILLDPAYYLTKFLNSSYSSISCVDQLDCDYLLQKNYKNVFFLPHAVESDLHYEGNGERPYDVVFIGSSYDPFKIRESWPRIYSAPIVNLIEESVEITLSNKETPFWKAVEDCVNQRGIDLNRNELIQIANSVDSYVRGIDRLELIQSIKDAEVHVFGGTCWGEGIKGWPQYFSRSKNIIVHPAVPFKESLEILKKSKISLNSMPFFKSGSHERIFTGLACGSLPVTTENLWVEKNFKEGEEIAFYRPTHWNEVNDKVNYYLSHENERKEMVLKGRSKVMAYHTWDQRVQQILKSMN